MFMELVKDWSDCYALEQVITATDTYSVTPKVTYCSYLNCFPSVYAEVLYVFVYDSEIFMCSFIYHQSYIMCALQPCCSDNQET